MANNDQWKDKYLNALEAAEATESRLKDAEDTLRLTVSRLTLVASGSDHQLDEQLDKLRRLTRKSPNNASIRALLEDISLTIKRLDIELSAKKPQRLPPHQFLAAIIERVSLPRKIQKKAKLLAKKLSKKNASQQLEELFAEFVELVNEALESAEAESSIITDKENRSLDIDTDTDWVENFCRLLLEKYSENQRLSKTCQELDEASTNRELNKALDRLVRLLPEEPKVGEQDAFSSATKGEPSSSSEPNSREIASHLSEESTTKSISPELRFIALLDKLSLPKNLCSKAEEIRRILDQTVEDEDWPAVLSRIADIVASMRLEVERERNELESFLIEITSQLQQIDNSLVDTQDHQKASMSSSETLDTSVRANLNEIQRSVESETDLTRLRQSISQRMEDISLHLKDFRDAELHRHEQMKTELTSLRQRVKRMESETSDLSDKLAEERQQARTDPLTGISNRIAYEQHLEREFLRWENGKTNLSTIVCDIDRFKSLNDSLGHQAGDKALQSIAQVLKQSVRKTDLLARYGGEEFVILVSHDQGTDVASQIAEKIRKEVENAEFKSKGERIPITISCGYSSFQQGDKIDSAFARADEALYRAKALGRNRVEQG